MKKSIVFLILLVTMFLTFACTSKEPSTISIGDKEFDAIFVKSGYYLDRASLSEAQFVDFLSKVTVIDKPNNLGKCEMPDFSNIVLKKTKLKDITEEEIDADIEKLRDSEKTYLDIKEKRAAKLGDKVIIDFSGTMNGEPLEGGSATDFDLDLGSNSLIPGFEEGVVGNMIGKKFTLNLVFPDDYIESLAKKPVTFEVTIKAIKESVTPEVDEEFIKNHSKTGATTLDAFKEEIKNKIKERQIFLINENVNYQLYTEIMEKATFEPTEEAIAWKFSELVDDVNNQVKNAGISITDYLSDSGTNIYELHSSIKENAVEILKSEILVNELQKYGKITLYENDVKEWFAIFSDVMGFGSDLTYESYKEYAGYDNLLNTITEDMLISKLTEKCKIEEVDSEENEEQ